MPSAVSQGSALPAGSTRAGVSKAIFGFRLASSSGPIPKAPGSAGGYLLMVRMLVADDATKLVRAVVLQRGLARQIGDADHPAEPGFGAELLGRYHPVRPVEGAGHDLDPRAIDAAEAERGAAIPAKIALGDGGRAERGPLAAGPGEVLAVNVGKLTKGPAGGPFAHPAMTDADFDRQRRHRKADGAALAAAGQDGFRSRAHAPSVSR